MWVLCLKSWQLRKRADEQKRIKKKSLQKTSKVETLSARPFMRLFKIWMTITKPIHKKSKSFLRVFSWLLHSLTCSSRSAVWLSLTNWCSGPSINQPIKKPHWVITSQTVWAKTEERDTQSEGCRLPLPCRKENKTWANSTAMCLVYSAVRVWLEPSPHSRILDASVLAQCFSHSFGLVWPCNPNKPVKRSGSVTEW